jgi:hypothetical protein
MELYHDNERTYQDERVNAGDETGRTGKKAKWL